MLKDVSRDVALKFRADGTARPFAGNTIICHLPQESRLRDAFVDVHKDLFRSGFARKLGILSTASLHMTIFTGAEDQEREGGWPSYVPKNASMQDCTNMVLQRMKDFRLQCNLPFRMVIDAEKTRTSPGIGVIQLRTIDEVEEEKLRRLRDRLSKTFGFRGADHDSFGFHVTLAYQLSNFTATEKAEYRRILERCLLHLTLAPPALELGIPEFCVFADMNRFDTELLLRTQLLPGKSSFRSESFSLHPIGYIEETLIQMLVRQEDLFDRSEYLCALVLADDRMARDEHICGWFGHWAWRNRDFDHISGKLKEERANGGDLWPIITGGVFASLTRFDEVVERHRTACLLRFTYWQAFQTRHNQFGKNGFIPSLDDADKSCCSSGLWILQPNSNPP